MSLPSLESTLKDFLDKDLQWESLLFLLDDHHLTVGFRQAMLVRSLVAATEQKRERKEVRDMLYVCS